LDLQLGIGGAQVRGWVVFTKKVLGGHREGLGPVGAQDKKHGVGGPCSSRAVLVGATGGAGDSPHSSQRGTYDQASGGVGRAFAPRGGGGP